MTPAKGTSGEFLAALLGVGSCSGLGSVGSGFGSFSGVCSGLGSVGRLCPGVMLVGRICSGLGSIWPPAQGWEVFDFSLQGLGVSGVSAHSRMVSGENCYQWTLLNSAKMALKKLDSTFFPPHAGPMVEE